jgi:protein-disulfide isomerase
MPASSRTPSRTPVRTATRPGDHPVPSRRQEARAAAARLQAEQERAARRARTLVAVVLVAALVLLGGVVAAILSEADDAASGVTTSTSGATPAGATASGAIPVGASGVAGTTDGTGVDPVVVSVYADYLCPFCGLFERTNAQTVDGLRASGDVVVEYHPVSILDRLSAGSDYSTRAATAAALVADRAPEAFVAFNHALYVDQPDENTPGLSDHRLAEVARSAGVPDDVAATIADGSYLTGDDSFTGWVAAATERAAADLPRLATPAILIDGELLDTEQYDWTQPGRLAAAIDAARG